MNPSISRPQRVSEGAPAWEGMQQEQLESWLDGLPANKPVDAARALTRQIVAMRKAEFAVRTRLKLLDQLREKSESLLPAIESRLNVAPLPLPPALQQAVIAANDLLKQLAISYTAIAATLSGRWYGLSSNRPLRDAVINGLRLNLRRVKLAYRVYARGSRSAWTSLHRLYGIAHAAGIADLSEENETDTPEQLYIKALLLAFAEPAKLGPGELDQVRFYLDRYGSLARLQPASTVKDFKEPAAFLIRPSEARPGRSLVRWRKAELHPDDQVLYCGLLVHNLLSQIAGLNAGISPARLGLPKAAEGGRYVTLLRSLSQLWSASPTRRYARARFHPRVDVVVGFSTLWSFLGGAAYQRRSEDELARSVVAGDMTEWTVSNESPDGFALRYVSGNASEIRVGEILGIRPRDNAAVQVCVARRAANTLASLELGVQMLASRAMAATITLPPKNPPGSVTQRLVRVIFVPRLLAIGNAPALLAPHNSLSSGMEFAVGYDGKRTMMRIDNRVERTSSCEVFALSRLPAAGAVASSGHTQAVAA